MPSVEQFFKTFTTATAALDTEQPSGADAALPGAGVAPLLGSGVAPLLGSGVAPSLGSGVAPSLGSGGAFGAEAIGEHFAEQFLFADATGARPVSRADFLRALPRRAEMFASLRIGRAELVGLTSTRLDQHYVLVRTEWTAPRLTGGDPVPMTSSYLLHDDGKRLRIVLYLNHESPLTA